MSKGVHSTMCEVGAGNGTANAGHDGECLQQTSQSRAQCPGRIMSVTDSASNTHGLQADLDGAFRAQNVQPVVGVHHFSQRRDHMVEALRRQS
eukprot:137123-Rhodomonas_salina.2